MMLLKKHVFLLMLTDTALKVAFPALFVIAWKSVWHTPGPSRATFFVWSVALSKILTLDNLGKWHVIVINRCYMCKKTGESSDHLLLHCDVASVL
jgi:hypothetical protein